MLVKKAAERVLDSLPGYCRTGYRLTSYELCQDDAGRYWLGHPGCWDEGPFTREELADFLEDIYDHEYHQLVLR